jgi:hypothetical protein
VEIFEQCALKTTEVLQFFGGTMIGNEFHYIFCCELLKDIRTKYMPNYFIICPCEAKMNTMLKIGNTQVLTHLSLFLQKIVKLL